MNSANLKQNTFPDISRDRPRLNHWYFPLIFFRMREIIGWCVFNFFTRSISMFDPIDTNYLSVFVYLIKKIQTCKIFSVVYLHQTRKLLLFQDTLQKCINSVEIPIIFLARYLIIFSLWNSLIVFCPFNESDCMVWIDHFVGYRTAVRLAALILILR